MTRRLIPFLLLGLWLSQCEAVEYVQSTAQPGTQIELTSDEPANFLPVQPLTLSLKGPYLSLSTDEQRYVSVIYTGDPGQVIVVDVLSNGPVIPQVVRHIITVTGTAPPDVVDPVDPDEPGPVSPVEPDDQLPETEWNSIGPITARAFSTYTADVRRSVHDAFFDAQRLAATQAAPYSTISSELTKAIKAIDDKIDISPAYGQFVEAFNQLSADGRIENLTDVAGVYAEVTVWMGRTLEGN